MHGDQFGEFVPGFLGLKGLIQYLSHVVCRNTPHVVMHCRYHRYRVSGYVYTSKDHGRFRDARKTCLESLCRQM